MRGSQGGQGRKHVGGEGGMGGSMVRGQLLPFRDTRIVANTVLPFSHSGRKLITSRSEQCSR